MKTNLFICLKIPLNANDFNRFGIDYLNKRFNLVILDCSKWLLPYSQNRVTSVLNTFLIIEIRNFKQFKNYLKNKSGYVIDYIGQFSPKSIIMFDFLVKNNFNLVVIDTVPFPIPEKLISSNIIEKFKQTILFGGWKSHIFAKINKILLYFLVDQSPKIALTSGTFWKYNSRYLSSKKKVNGHSLDYEIFMKVSDEKYSNEFLKSKRYAVYIDENLTNHPDNLEVGFPNPATSAKFYPRLKKFFKIIKNRFKLNIICATYPSGNNEFGKYISSKSFSNLTPQLIKNCDLVLAHGSTAISFAILWKKPIIFITSSEIEKSWYNGWIEAPSKYLKSPLINIDDFKEEMLQKKINNKCYQDYKNNFIKTFKSEKVSLWKILYNVIKEDVRNGK